MIGFSAVHREAGWDPAHSELRTGLRERCEEPSSIGSLALPLEARLRRAYAEAVRAHGHDRVEEALKGYEEVVREIERAEAEWTSRPLWMGELLGACCRYVAELRERRGEWAAAYAAACQALGVRDDDPLLWIQAARLALRTEQYAAGRQAAEHALRLAEDAEPRNACVVWLARQALATALRAIGDRRMLERLGEVPLEDTLGPQRRSRTRAEHEQQRVAGVHARACVCEQCRDLQWLSECGIRQHSPRGYVTALGILVETLCVLERRRENIAASVPLSAPVYVRWERHRLSESTPAPVDEPPRTQIDPSESGTPTPADQNEAVSTASEEEREKSTPAVRRSKRVMSSQSSGKVEADARDAMGSQTPAAETEGNRLEGVADAPAAYVDTLLRRMETRVEELFGGMRLEMSPADGRAEGEEEVDMAEGVEMERWVRELLAQFDADSPSTAALSMSPLALLLQTLLWVLDRPDRAGDAPGRVVVETSHRALTFFQSHATEALREHLLPSAHGASSLGGAACAHRLLSAAEVTLLAGGDDDDDDEMSWWLRSAEHALRGAREKSRSPSARARLHIVRAEWHRRQGRACEALLQLQRAQALLLSEADVSSDAAAPTLLNERRTLSPAWVSAAVADVQMEADVQAVRQQLASTKDAAACVIHRLLPHVRRLGYRAPPGLLDVLDAAGATALTDALRLWAHCQACTQKRQPSKRQRTVDGTAWLDQARSRHLTDALRQSLESLSPADDTSTLCAVLAAFAWPLCRQLFDAQRDGGLVGRGPREHTLASATVVLALAVSLRGRSENAPVSAALVYRDLLRLLKQTVFNGGVATSPGSGSDTARLLRPLVQMYDTALVHLPADVLDENDTALDASAGSDPESAPEALTRERWQCLRFLYGIEAPPAAVAATVAPSIPTGDNISVAATADASPWLPPASLLPEPLPLPADLPPRLLHLCGAELEEALASRARPRLRAAHAYVRAVARRVRVKDTDGCRRLMLLWYRLFIDFIDTEYKRIAEPERRVKWSPADWLQQATELLQQLRALVPPTAGSDAPSDAEVELALAVTLRHVAQLSLETGELLGDGNAFRLESWVQQLVTSYALAERVQQQSADAAAKTAAARERVWSAYTLVSAMIPAPAWAALPPSLQQRAQAVMQALPPLVDSMQSVAADTDSTEELQTRATLLYVQAVTLAALGRLSECAPVARRLFEGVERAEAHLPLHHQQLHSQVHVQYSPLMEHRLLALVLLWRSATPLTAEFDVRALQASLQALPYYKAIWYRALLALRVDHDARAALDTLSGLFRIDTGSTSRHGYFWLIWNHRYMLPPEGASTAPIWNDSHAFAHWQFRCFALLVYLLDALGEYETLWAVQRALVRRLHPSSAVDAECLALIAEKNLAVIASEFRASATGAALLQSPEKLAAQLQRPVDLRPIWRAYLDAELVNELLDSAAPLPDTVTPWPGAAAMVDATTWPLRSADFAMPVSGQAVLELAERLLASAMQVDASDDGALARVITRCSKWLGNSSA
eukprot:ctg_366.g210